MVGPILGGSSDVALCADVAPLAHNHLDCRDLLRRRVIHDGRRKALATIRPEEMLTDDPPLVALMAIADYFERTPEWPQEIGTDPEPSRTLLCC